MLFLYEREVDPNLALALEGNPEIGWLLEKLDREHKKRIIERERRRTLSFYRAYVGARSKKGNDSLHKWIKKAEKDLEKLNADVTIWQRFRETGPKETIWNRLRGNKANAIQSRGDIRRSKARHKKVGYRAKKVK